MSKTIFVIEQADNHGEFQPVPGQSYSDKQSAALNLDQQKHLSGGKRVRVMPYVRKLGGV